MPRPTVLPSTRYLHRRETVSQFNAGNVYRALRIIAGLILVALARFGLIGVRSTSR